MEELDVLHITHLLGQGLEFHSVAGKKVPGVPSTGAKEGHTRLQR